MNLLTLRCWGHLYDMQNPNSGIGRRMQCLKLMAQTFIGPLRFLTDAKVSKYYLGCHCYV